MKELNRYLVYLACISTLVLANAALGDDVTLTCPAQANAGETVNVDMTFSNDQCAAQTLRIMSSVVGNATDSLAGVGIFGPVVAVASVIVPAGTDRFCGCTGNLCGCDFNQFGSVQCSTDADCGNCSANTPGTKSVFFDSAIDFPVSLRGTVATQLFITEIETGTEIDTEINECFVEVL